MLHDVGSQQMVDFPPRNDNTLDILDIFCTNRPSLEQRCVPIPGLSEHDIDLEGNLLGGLYICEKQPALKA